MLETTYDIRIKKLKEQKNGVWFPFNKNKNLKAIEFIGRSQSYSIKSFPFLRKKIGTNTCKWWTVSGAFIWIRIWVVASTGMENPIVNFINPIITGSAEAFLLSLYSYF